MFAYISRLWVGYVILWYLCYYFVKFKISRTCASDSLVQFISSKVVFAMNTLLDRLLYLCVVGTRRRDRWVGTGHRRGDVSVPSLAPGDPIIHLATHQVLWSRLNRGSHVSLVHSSKWSNIRKCLIKFIICYGDRWRSPKLKSQKLFYVYSKPWSWSHSSSLWSNGRPPSLTTYSSSITAVLEAS